MDSTLQPKKRRFPVSGFVSVSCNTMLMEAHEYVCRGDAVVSDLKWPLVPSLSYMVSGGVYLPKGIHIEGNVSFLQAMKTGTMIDLDYEGILDSPPQMGITKRSEHVCNIISGVCGTVKAGIQLAMPQTEDMQQAGISALIEPMISFYYSTIKWHSYGGYLQYAKMKKDGSYEPWSGALPKVLIGHDAVSYQQQVYLPAIGIGCEVLFPHNILLTSDFHVCPNIMAISEDIHHARNLRFIDVLDEGWAIHGTTRLTWKCFPFCAVFCSLFYQYAKTTEGRSMIYAGLSDTKPARYTDLHTAGTALYGCSLAIGLAFVVGR